jgi:hypothetical protein
MSAAETAVPENGHYLRWCLAWAITASAKKRSSLSFVSG